ncbi:PAS domain S-box protein [Nostoc sp. FACHB-152]|uniref:PAS domain S-box protein n=1 Tax=unclassified Nostoc TaxID=2593658 RepID=UPI001683A460|nr:MULTISPECIES: PAS domain S-box protein [unclassified Nostoc]MBD2448794.1 PAS domain S-box protein [Nostoc sp. FACHB-152]MBD2467573.1 PAS domain S-box protein [Nostoc sp. FACHB-145]
MTEVKAGIVSQPSAIENREIATLSESEERFRLLLEASPDGFIILRSVWDAAGEIADFIIEYTNPVAARGVNRKPEELLGQYLLHLFPDCQTSGIFARYVAVAETGISTTFETFYDSKESAGWFRNVVVKLNDGIAVSFSNITDRKQAELALQQQQQHFRIALQTAKLGSWEHDLTTGILTCSAQCKANFGLPPDAEFTHETLFAALHPDDRPLVQAAIERAIQERIDYEVEERCYHPDGSLHWLIVRGQLVYGSNGTPLRMVGVTLDITEQKLSEASLRLANQRISNILESITDAFVAFDRDWRYTYVNQEAAKMLGRSPQELLGKLWQEVFSDSQKDALITAQFERAMAAQTTVRFEAFSLILNRWLDISLFPSPDGLAMYFRDISDRVQFEEELRQRETELRLITNAVPVLISFVDSQQRYRFNNQKYEEWFGKPTTQVYGRHLREVLGEAVYAKIRPYVEQVLAGQEVSFESKLPFKVAGTRFVSVSYIPRFDQQGKVEGFVALVRDITQRKQAEESLSQSEERLRIAQQAANAGVWDWDIVNNQVTWSEEYYRLYGLERATIQPSYKNWLRSIVEIDRDRVDQSARKALIERSDLNVEFRILHPSRGERWLTAIGQTFYDDNGQPQRMTGIALDITERKQVELALAKSNQTLQAIIQACPLAIMGLQADGTVKIWNPAAEKIFGWSQEEVLGKFLPAIPKDKRNEFLNNIAATIQGNVLAGLETQRQTKGNLFIDVALWSAPVEEAQVGISCVSIVADITERKTAEAALRQSEAFNRQILESSEDCIKVLDLNGSLLYMSPGGQKLLKADDITPFLGHSWVKFWQEADQPAAQETLNQAKTNGVGTFQGYCPTLAGEPKYWDVKVTPIRDANGQIEHLLCISRDITTRKQATEALCQSEERYRYLAESIPQLVWTANTEGVLIDINQRWSNFTGLTLAEAKTGGWQAIVHPDDLPILGQKWAIAQQNSSYYQAEGRMRRVDGVYRWHLHQAVPLKNEQGQVIKWFGTATDIEDQKQLEQQRTRLLEQEQAAREQAETANRIKDEFLAVLSHELRSPLNPILGWTKLLQTRKFDQSGTKQALQTIERNAKLQIQLIDDLLDISRILRGKMMLNVSPVNLAEVVDAAIETVRLSAEAKGIEIKPILTNIGLLSGDSGRLQQIVWNLLANAVKFTPNGGKIEIRLEKVGTDVQIQVKDTGKGITPAFLPHVFEYFRQEDSTTTRKFGGLGLGLAIVKYFTELHGGTVEAESPGEGRGATFKVKLPMMPPQAQSNQNVGTEPALDLNGMKILVVDDDADSREFVAFVLEQEKANVAMAGSATEALAVLSRFQPDILLSDIGMPQINGYMLMQQVRNLLPDQGGNIKAIALTAYAGEINEKQAIAAGFQKHLPKPVEPEQLIRAITELVRN